MTPDAFESGPSSGFVLGPGFETYTIEFERKGIRAVVLLRRASSRWPKGWVASVEPSVPDPNGQEHTEVVLTPYRSYVVADLSVLEPGQHVDVNVGPAADAQDDPRECPWYVAAFAQSAADLPQRRGASDLALLLEWAESHPGKPGPSWADEADGVQLLLVADHLRRRQFHGIVGADVVKEFERVPGWEWWDGDEIDLLDSYLTEGGEIPIPEETLYRGRPVARYPRLLLCRYDHGRTLMRYWESGRWKEGRAPDGSIVRRLDEKPWWPQVRQVAAERMWEELKSIPGWGAKESPVDLLIRFVEREGHCHVPEDYVADDGQPLGILARGLAAAYHRESALAQTPGGAPLGFVGSSERSRLEAIPGWKDFVEAARAETQAFVNRILEICRNAPKTQPPEPS